MDIQLYTAKEVAKMLKISMPTIFKLIRNNEIQCKKIGREWRFTENDIKEFVNKR